MGAEAGTDAAPAPAASGGRAERAWWRDAVAYQIYPRSFADSDGDGVGDLTGIRRRLGHVAGLGVDAIWLTPFYRSPMADHGYDVADYRDVDPVFGTLADVDGLIADAHRLGLRVIVDIVPNHTSSEHPWFRAALAAGPQSPERERYLFRRGRGDGSPPNNWQSRFGGPAWTRVEDDWWYLHLFAPEQPDLNWRHPEVAEEFRSVLRFWLDRGVDGFRIDVAHGLFKSEDLRDVGPGEGHHMSNGPIWSRPEVHAVYRDWRRLLDGYSGERMAVGEVWVDDPVDLARYIRPDELHQAFNFAWLTAPWSAESFHRVITESLAATAPVGATTTWVLSNHDVVRHVTRYGGGETGVRRARAALLAMLALPGAVYLYQGEELGLPEVLDLPDEVLQDPKWERSGRTQRGRDGCRVPIPWTGERPPFGFTRAEATPWLPPPADWSGLTVAAQDADPASTLNLYRRALRIRKAEPSLGDGSLSWVDLGPGVLAFAREPGLLAVLNCGTEPVALPPHREVVLSSAEPDAAAPGRLPPDTAVWLRR
ncbi:glycoside hydrolase family 13 protein [Allonocardiopsis opalescens]|uniref:glycoside hydrolase family 13 protein n=1 Tax=Allonocardiopsis opalescens TaxID=1144618 RepID=UPI003CCC20A5